MHLAHQRAPYIVSVATFLAADPSAVIGQLSLASDGDVTAMQLMAWECQIRVLQTALDTSMEGMVCFEFVIPRVGRRVDNIVLLGDHVVVIEFKVGAAQYDSAAKTQVMDYALDLKNFHQESHSVLIAPVLVATDAAAPEYVYAYPVEGVYPILLANGKSLAAAFQRIAAHSLGAATLCHETWLRSGYRPTPTIIEASQVLYRGHGVSEITHSEAGAENLGATTMALASAIDGARKYGQKVICLVSGVPGAGKTLAGLNLVCERRKHDQADIEHAVFLSGNGPLVQVLQEALARDEVAQAKCRGEMVIKSSAHRKAVAFIQNIHHFRDESLKDLQAPTERVVVFDEAQRAWDRQQTSKFMRNKRNLPNFDQSEPEFLIGVMDRHEGWAAIVCLVGGGQEINTGEAGIEEWLRALRDHFPHWLVHLPSQLETIDYLREFKLSDLQGTVTRSPALHLSVPLRSFRAERLSKAIAALMTAQPEPAKDELQAVLKSYPITITRSVQAAKDWLKARARGSERFGLLASSGAKRIKPLGFNMDVKIDPCAWFLNDDQDVRSSFYLEDAASEFDVQGLELDWSAVVWDGDLVHQPSGWRCKNFKGTRWQEIRDPDAQRYRVNAYRVLLTRARQGMVIVVPEGNTNDSTRSPEFYDPTWQFLCALGLPQLVYSPPRPIGRVLPAASTPRHVNFQVTHKPAGPGQRLFLE